MNNNLCVFESDTIIGALSMVKSALGEEAVIVDTKRIKPFLGLGKEKITITAVGKNNSLILQDITDELKNIKSQLTNINNVQFDSIDGFSKEFIKKFISYFSDKERFYSLLNKMIEEGKPVNGEGIYFFVGPTGSGKTTTIAKIAGNLLRSGKKNIVLLSFDYFRIGAVEQLRKYAKIMGIEFDLAKSVKDLVKKVNKYKNNIVLVDSFGLSPFDNKKLTELESFVNIIDDKKTYLCIELFKYNYPKDIIKKYFSLNPDFITITKTDEINTIKSIAEISFKAQKPISYITNGQNVPDDIAVFNKDKFIGQIVNEFFGGKND
jgi:flagellar biosynthesis protein FlhF